MTAGSRDRPSMLATRRYPQWNLRFLRYIDTRPNVAATDDSPAIPEHITVETPMNMSPANKAHFEAEKEVMHLILTGIRDEIYSTVDACQTTQEMWEAIERTSSNSKNKNVDMTPRYKDDNQFGQFGNQRTVNVVGARENELEAHYSYMAKIQEVPTGDSGTDSEPLEQNDQSDVESDDERVVLANLKLDVDENKKIQNQLKKANTTLAQELKECKDILVETSKTLGESISVRDSCLVALQNKQTEFEKYKAFNDRTVDYDKLECIRDVLLMLEILSRKFFLKLNLSDHRTSQWRIYHILTESQSRTHAHTQRPRIHSRNFLKEHQKNMNTSRSIHKVYVEEDCQPSSDVKA
nr:hypothetical protein [Tanacetum cinerariifolium]